MSDYMESPEEIPPMTQLEIDYEMEGFREYSDSINTHFTVRELIFIRDALADRMKQSRVFAEGQEATGDPHGLAQCWRTTEREARGLAHKVCEYLAAVLRKRYL
jgi:hypothetical protein